MTEERCKHDLPADQCGDCREPPPGLTKRVFITSGGKVFHRITSCAALHEGQRYAARRGRETHEPVLVTLAEAQSDGRAACLACFPDYHPGQPQRPDPSGDSPEQAETLKQLAATLDAARRSVSAALAAEVDRGELTDIVAHAIIDIRAQVWPNAAPIRMGQPARDPEA